MKKEELQYRETIKGREIFDSIRKTWIIATPEEIVRQNLIKILITKGYPREYIAIEQGFYLASGKPQRADIIVHTQNGNPFMLIECKATTVKLNENVFTQTTKYNAIIRAPYIFLSNLKTNYIFHTEDFINYSHENTLPEFPL